MQKIRKGKVKDMGKIRLNNGQELEIIADGIQAAGDFLTLGLVPGDKTLWIMRRYCLRRQIQARSR